MLTITIKLQAFMVNETEKWRAFVINDANQLMLAIGDTQKEAVTKLVNELPDFEGLGGPKGMMLG